MLSTSFYIKIILYIFVWSKFCHLFPTRCRHEKDTSLWLTTRKNPLTFCLQSQFRCITQNGFLLNTSTKKVATVTCAQSRIKMHQTIYTKFHLSAYCPRGSTDLQLELCIVMNWSCYELHDLPPHTSCLQAGNTVYCAQNQHIELINANCQQITTCYHSLPLKLSPSKHKKYLCLGVWTHLMTIHSSIVTYCNYWYVSPSLIHHLIHVQLISLWDFANLLTSCYSLIKLTSRIIVWTTWGHGFPSLPSLR